MNKKRKKKVVVKKKKKKKVAVKKKKVGVRLCDLLSNSNKRQQRQTKNMNVDTHTP